MSSGYIGEAFGAAQRAREIVEQLKAERARQRRVLRVQVVLMVVNAIVDVWLLGIALGAWS